MSEPDGSLEKLLIIHFAILMQNKKFKNCITGYLIIHSTYLSPPTFKDAMYVTTRKSVIWYTFDISTIHYIVELSNYSSCIQIS